VLGTRDRNSAVDGYADCDAATVTGRYAAMANGIYYFDGIPSVAMGHITFDGDRRVVLQHAREGAAGELEALSGSGTYRVSSNCQGLAGIRLRDSSGVDRGTLRFDFIVSGNASEPTLTGILSNSDPATAYTGQAVLRRIDF
jgi:hypothetical protein